MHYPFIIYSRKIELKPIFRALQGEPYIADLSPDSELLKDIDMRDQQKFQSILEEQMGKGHSWGVAAYLENRDTLLADCPQMVKERRFIHLGLDIIVGLGTPLHAPLDAIVAESGYESANDVRELRRVADAVLIGSALMKLDDPAERIRELRGGGAARCT